MSKNRLWTYAQSPLFYVYLKIPSLRPNFCIVWSWSHFITKIMLAFCVCVCITILLVVIECPEILKVRSQTPFLLARISSLPTFKTRKLSLSSCPFYGILHRKGILAHTNYIYFIQIHLQKQVFEFSMGWVRHIQQWWVCSLC